MSLPEENDLSGGAPDSAGSQSKPDGASKIEFSSDESWKEAAQKEKERLDKETKKSGAAHELPPASFASLLNDLGLQAMLSLGGLAAEGEAPPVNLQAARYIIDTFGVLEEKTKNNLSAGESQALTDLLNTLRMQFVETSRRLAKEGQKIVTDETLIKDPKDLREQKPS